MFKSGWTVAGLGLLFVVVQSCGEEFATGRITTPGVTGDSAQALPDQAQSAAPLPSAMREGTGDPAFEVATFEVPPPEERVRPMAVRTVVPGGEPEQPTWPDYRYDDGSELWDGGVVADLGTWKWNKGATELRGQNGRRFQVTCVADRTEYAVWGMNPFTDDSPVCTAAGMLGLINRERGGRVVFEIRPAQRSFLGGSANGVVALPWGPYPGSYRLIP